MCIRLVLNNLGETAWAVSATAGGQPDHGSEFPRVDHLSKTSHIKMAPLHAIFKTAYLSLAAAVATYVLFLLCMTNGTAQKLYEPTWA